LSGLEHSMLNTKDYFGRREVKISFSRIDYGLIAIGEPDGLGVRWIHLNVNDLVRVILIAEKNWKYGLECENMKKRYGATDKEVADFCAKNGIKRYEPPKPVVEKKPAKKTVVVAKKPVKKAAVLKKPVQKVAKKPVKKAVVSKKPAKKKRGKL